MENLLSIKNLSVSIEETSILKGINLDVKTGQMHAIMGPNGSGKSSMAYALMGHPRYDVTNGSMKLLSSDLSELSPDKRAKQGMFLALQHPLEIEGVALKDFLRQSYNALYDGTERQLKLRQFAKHLIEKLYLLKMDVEFGERPLNVGFSGGEKKKAEILQLAVLQPKLAILDEIDSGLDIDALKTVCEAINTVRKDNPEMSFVVITHYKRILEYLNPDFVHVLQDGKIVRSGGPEVADDLEEHGYE